MNSITQSISNFLESAMDLLNQPWGWALGALIVMIIGVILYIWIHGSWALYKMKKLKEIERFGKENIRKNSFMDKILVRQSLKKEVQYRNLFNKKLEIEINKTRIEEGLDPLPLSVDKKSRLASYVSLGSKTKTLNKN